MQEKCI